MGGGGGGFRRIGSRRVVDSSIDRGVLQSAVVV